jgi:hypothetical protein
MESRGAGCFPLEDISPASESILSSLMAHALYSGVLLMGSRAGLVRRLAIASSKWQNPLVPLCVEVSVQYDNGIRFERGPN